MAMSRSGARLSYRGAKRIVDVTIAAAGLVLTAPLLAPIAVAVRVSSPGPVLFRHERVGRRGRKFHVLKFRTMVHGSVGAQVTAAGDPRVTRIGKLLRASKLDELPQLWNVLVGDMSLVGPRPEVERYVRMYPEDYEDILRVRPGITDFASIEYRNEEGILANAIDPESEYSRLVLPAKIRLYRRYFAEQSLWTDFTILARTVAAVLKLDDASCPAERGSHGTSARS
jgi:lipopolysaccharide/colanic/teichoic acid biosynthesis glycosyltransferase